MPLLWVHPRRGRPDGTKYGCGIAQCGACTVHVDGVAVRSCSLPVGDVSGAGVTIEGLGASGDHPVQIAWAGDERAAVRLLSERADDGRRRVPQ